MSTPWANLKAAYFTLGCKLNFAESSTMGKLLAERGIRRALPGERPDICVVNTCSVTSVADKKGRQLIRSLGRRYPDATIVVTGCYAQLKPEEVIALPGVDIVLGSNEKLLIADYIDQWRSKKEILKAVGNIEGKTEFMPSCERGDRTRYFLKVQDGCDYFCTYCTIPFARGRSRSAEIPDLVAKAAEVAEEGGREIVLTGVNVGDFGKGRKDNFFDLIRALERVEGIRRYRISSIEPNLLTADIIRWVARESEKFMPHFHIPLQSGSDKVLRLMNRRYDTSLFADRIRMIREELPGAFIGIDVIAGSRGETQDEWHKGYRFIEGLDVSALHVFPYSERPGTKALSLDDPVSAVERQHRVAELMKLSDEKENKFRKSQLGSVHKVLWEHPGKEMEYMYGFTENYIRARSLYTPELINTITEITLQSEDIEQN